MSDILLKVGAHEQRLRPTYEAYDRLETLLDGSLPQIYEAHRAGMLRLADYADIVAVGMIQAGAEADKRTVKRHLHADRGPTDPIFRRKIAEFLLALGWHPEQAGKKLEAEWSETAMRDAVEAIDLSSVLRQFTLGGARENS